MFRTHRLYSSVFPRFVDANWDARSQIPAAADLLADLSAEAETDVTA